MSLSRLFLPLLFVLALLAAQQAGAVHAISHALEQSQQDQHAPHSPACEKCASYAQLGSALNVGAYAVALLTVSGEAIVQFSTLPLSSHALVAAARGPPAPL